VAEAGTERAGSAVVSGGSGLNRLEDVVDSVAVEEGKPRGRNASSTKRECVQPQKFKDTESVWKTCTLPGYRPLNLRPLSQYSCYSGR